MEEQLVEDMLIILKEMEAELHGSLGKRKVHRLHKKVTQGISRLEDALQKKKHGGITPEALLSVLTSVVGVIPKIVQAIAEIKK